MELRTPSGDRGLRRRGSAGYTLAALIGILAVLAILLGMAMPVWASRVQRAREAELIARGLQYAEAIRVFRGRFGRLPNRLSELVELEPRSIRRLWGNPFVGPEGGWLVLLEGPGGQLVTLDPETGDVVPTGEGAAGAGETLTQRSTPRSPIVGGGPAPSAGGPGVAGPVHGVRSRVGGESYRRFFDQTDYGQWEFIVELLVGATSAPAPDGLPRRADYSTIGKPFRYPPPGGVAVGGPPGATEPHADSPPPQGLPEGVPEGPEGSPAENER